MKKLCLFCGFSYVKDLMSFSAGFTHNNFISQQSEQKQCSDIKRKPLGEITNSSYNMMNNSFHNDFSKIPQMQYAPIQQYQGYEYSIEQDLFFDDEPNYINNQNSETNNEDWDDFF